MSEEVLATQTSTGPDEMAAYLREPGIHKVRDPAGFAGELWVGDTALATGHNSPLAHLLPRPDPGLDTAYYQMPEVGGWGFGMFDGFLALTREVQRAISFSPAALGLFSTES